MEEVKGDPGLKDYIMSTRKSGFSDDKIKEGLKKAGWPPEVIDATYKLFDPSTSPTIVQQPVAKPAEIKLEEKKEPIIVQDKKDDLFTKPDILQEAAPLIKEEPKKAKKSFSILALVAFLLSPIPFIGLGVAMAALESISKHKQSGMILAVLALLINLGMIGLILYILYQIFTLSPDQLTGFSRYIVDNFGLAQV